MTRKFVQKLYDNAFKIGETALVLFSNFKNRAENVFEKISGWTITLEDRTAIRNSKNLQARLFAYSFSDFSLKKTKYSALTNQLLKEINSILITEGVKDWTINSLSFRGHLIILNLSRPNVPLSDNFGVPSGIETLDILVSFFVMKGFYIVNADLWFDKYLLFASQYRSPSYEDIKILDTNYSYYERERYIDEVWEKTITEIEKKAEQEKTPLLERTEEIIKKILMWVVIILILYYIIAHWATIKSVVKLGEKAVREED